MAGFAQALADNPAPSRLGDVFLRYEPSMLVGETKVDKPTWRPTALVALGLGLLVAGVVMLAFASELVALPFVLGSAGALTGSVWLTRRERRKRGFVLNFATTSLRLDFMTPIAGRPRTIVVHFDHVKAVTLLEQGDGLECLTVDFEHEGDVLREVLVAFIPDGERAAAARFGRLLEAAFGLGIPAPAKEPDAVIDEFYSPPSSPGDTHT